MQHPVGPSTPVRDFSPLGMWTTGGNPLTAGSRLLPPLFPLQILDVPHIIAVCPPQKSFITVSETQAEREKPKPSEQRAGEGSGDPSALSAW